LLSIDVIVAPHPRAWQKRLLDRLAAAGHSLGISVGSETPAWPVSAGLALGFERHVLRRPAELTGPATIDPAPLASPADLVVDLTGRASVASVPMLRVAFDGTLDDGAVLSILAAGCLPEVEILLDGSVFERAVPMVDRRTFVTSAAEDVLARAITAVLKSVHRFALGDRATTPLEAATQPPAFGAAYVTSALPRIGRELLRRARYRSDHWRVGYRLIDGPGVAETDEIGREWCVLPDDGTHFYADPFPFEQDGMRYIFVEDYAHSCRKAVISVSILDEHGVATKPVPVLVEPHHLSYPQVFAFDGTIYMLPEGIGSGKLTLYRAVEFPNRWEPVADLIVGEISDATLLHRDDGLWLFATDRDGAGSTSDTMVVFHAPALAGPWTPHKQNPIMIDRRRARPGGAIIEQNGRLVLPVQDGTLGYGGGLGLSEIVLLDRDNVELAAPRPVATVGDFPYRRIHTLNRAGRLEVIDGIAVVRRS